MQARYAILLVVGWCAAAMLVYWLMATPQERCESIVIEGVTVRCEHK